MFSENSFALIGIGCRFPGGADSLDALWDILSNGVDAVTQVPEERFDLSRFWHKDRNMPGHTCTVSAGIVGDVRQFDAQFFNMSVKEAQALDPQQRMVLEMAWEAFEDAGIPPSDAAGTKTAVYIGAASTDMGLRHVDDSCAAGPYTMTGTSLSIISNRVSYFFDLHGPSMTIDTACSSSLVALNEACRAMTDEKLPMALVGGVNVLLAPMAFVGFSKAHMLSEDGRCKVFDKSGNGYVRAEGGAVVLLKPLEAAVRDGNRIHAVIRTSAVNSDGRTNGIALPNGAAQKALLEDVYSRPGIDKSRVAYIEAHGTGTAAGDPIETRSIGEVLGHQEGEPLPVGSVKGNLGHLETGSGMAGLAKAVLVLEKKVIPQNLHFKNPNPAIHFDELGIKVPTEMVPLPTVKGKALVGLNSFGFGGTNAHVVLEEAPENSSSDVVFRTSGLLPFMISAKCAESLRTLAARYAELLEGAAVEKANRIVSAAALQRERLPVRFFMRADAVSELTAELKHYAEKGETVSPKASVQKSTVKAGRTAFVYSGNGSQWAGMCAGLYEKNPVFRRTIDEVDGFFAALSDWRIADVLTSPAEKWDLSRTEIAQPLLFAIQTAMTVCLADCGIKADCFAGHSVGEAAAAWAAGALTLEDAVRVIYERSSLQGTLRGTGVMAAVKLDRARFEEVMKDFPHVETAGFNSVDSFTVSGDEDEIDALGRIIKQCERGLFKKLAIPYAFHSSRMAPLEEPIAAHLEGLRPTKSDGVFYSTVTGRIESGDTLDVGYWWKNIRQPVRFEDAVSAMLADGVTRFVEVGPHAILTGYVRAVAKALKKEVHISGLLRREENETVFAANLLKTAASGWPVEGCWMRVPVMNELPRYAWNRRLCWPEETAESYRLFTPDDAHPLMGREVAHARHVWEQTLDTQSHEWLKGHEIDSTVLFPAAGYLEIARAAGAAFFEEGRAFEADNFFIERPLALADSPAKVLRTSVTNRGEIRIASRDLFSEEDWLEHAAGRLQLSDAPVPPALAMGVPSDAQALSTEELYEFAASMGLRYTDAFRPLVRAWKTDETTVTVEVESRSDDALDGEGLSPALVDGILQGLFFVLLGCKAEAAYLPTWFGKTVFWKTGIPKRGVVRLTRATEQSLQAVFEVYSETGEALMRMSDVRFRLVHRSEKRILPALYHEKWLADEPHSTLGMTLDEAAATLTDALKESDKGSGANLITGVLPERLSGMPVREVMNLLALAFVREHVRQKDEWVPAEILFGVLANETGESFARWFGDALVNAGLAEGDDGLYRVYSDTSFPSSELLFRTLMSQCPAYWPELLRGAAVAENFEALITGEKTTEDLFPARKSVLPEQCRRVPDRSALRRAVGGFLSGLGQKRAGSDVLRVCVMAAGADDVVRAAADLLPADSALTVAVTDASSVEKTALAMRAHANAAVVRFDPELPEALPEGAPFDLIIASDGLAVRGNVVQTLKGLRRALVPGGFVLTLEPADNIWSNFLFGTEKRWWTEAEGRVWSSLLDRDSWREAFAEAGFASSAEAVSNVLLPNFIAMAATPGAVVEPSVGKVSDKERVRRIVLLVEPQNVKQCSFAAKLTAAMTPYVKDVITSPSVPAGLGDDVRLVSLLGYGASDEHIETLALAQTLIARGTAFDVHVAASGTDSESARALLGFVRVWRNECPSCRIVYSALDEETDAAVDAFADRLTLKTSGTDDEAAIRADGVRLRPTVFAGELPREGDHAPLVLGFDVPGKLDRLVWKRAALPPLSEKGVRIDVKATCLNFRDVMWAMGLLPEEALENGFSGPTMGLECAGVVTEVGADVTSVKPGDAVLAFAPACFSTVVTTEENAVLPKPEALTFEEAASIPVAFYTAWYSISHLGRARKGESILIHGAAGGVGLAAIQVANVLGLEVYATAGSERKKSLLRALGVTHVYNSRTLAFADEILADTHGRGVDMVLNSLAGAGAEKSLGILAPFGRFLELGKRDFYADSPMFLRPFRRNISYFGIDVDQMLVDCPDLAATLFREVMSHFEAGDFRPLPILIFDAEEVSQAFQTMQVSHHVGKIVVSYDCRPKGVQKGRVKRVPIRRDGTYIVTGGFGGLGRRLAAELAREGAGAILLIGRREPDEGGRAFMTALEASGSEVHALALDTASDECVLRLEAALAGLPKLAGIIHAAGVTADATIGNLTPEAMALCAKKVEGAKHLDALSRRLGAKLDFFVLYSSATVLLGNPGQANYVAGNMALEAVAADRRREGLPATVIGWGPVGDVGMLKTNEKASKSLEAVLGAPHLTADQVAEATFSAVLEDDPVLHYLSVDWHHVLRMPGLTGSRLAGLRRTAGDGSREEVSLAEVLQGKTEEEGIEILVRLVTEEVAAIMGTPVSELNPLQPVSDIGMDSLMVVELAAALDERIGLRIPPVSLSGGATIRSIAERFYQMTVSREGGASDSESELVDTMSRQHGVELSADMKETLLKQ